LVSLCLFLNIDTWFIYVEGYIEYLVGDDPGNRVAVGLLAPLVTYGISIMFCLLPIPILMTATEILIKFEENYSS